MHELPGGDRTCGHGSHERDGKGCRQDKDILDGLVHGEECRIVERLETDRAMDRGSGVEELFPAPE